MPSRRGNDVVVTRARPPRVLAQEMLRLPPGRRDLDALEVPDRRLVEAHIRAALALGPIYWLRQLHGARNGKQRLEIYESAPYELRAEIAETYKREVGRTRIGALKAAVG